MAFLLRLQRANKDSLLPRLAGVKELFEILFYWPSKSDGSWVVALEELGLLRTTYNLFLLWKRKTVFGYFIFLVYFTF